MSIIGSNHHNERLSTLITRAHQLINSPSHDNHSHSSFTNGDQSKGDVEADLIQQELKDVISDAKAIITGLEPYVERNTSLPDPGSPSTKIIEKILQSTDQTDWKALHRSGQTRYELMSEMSSNRYEIGLISFLCDLLKPHRVLEIGMFTGTMTTIFGSARSVKKVIALEFEPFLVNWCKKFWKEGGDEIDEKIEIRVGDAKESLDQIVRDGEEAFDMILIDADKASYPIYFSKIIQNRLLSDNGILLIDNSIYKASTYVPFKASSTSDHTKDDGLFKSVNQNGKIIDDLNSEIAKNDDVDVILLPIRDGLSMIKWKS